MRRMERKVLSFEESSGAFSGALVPVAEVTELASDMMELAEEMRCEIVPRSRTL